MFEFLKNWIKKSDGTNISLPDIKKTNSYYRNLEICKKWQKKEDIEKKVLKKAKKAKKNEKRKNMV